MSNEIDNINERRSDQKFCHACASVMHANANHCPGCGAPQTVNSDQVVYNQSINNPQRFNNTGVNSNSSHCHGCGTLIHNSASSCPNCGALIRRGNSSKSKVIAGVLALFLGGFGFHHFYLGNILLGIIYLLFCWTFIPAIIAFFEALYYFFTSEENFARKYP